MVAEFCSLWQQKYAIQRFCLPHSSTFLCLVCVTLPSFSSISLYVVPSFCRSLSTFVLARFCRYCRSSSRVTAVFSVPRPFCSAFRASRCYLCAPFAFFFCSFLLFCSTITESLLYVQQLHQRQGHYKNVHRKNQARRSRGQGLGPPPPPPLLLEAGSKRRNKARRQVLEGVVQVGALRGQKGYCQ